MLNAAVVFDLDDTLYRERQFALSACAAVAAHLADRHDVSRDELVAWFAHALRHGRRAGAFQLACRRYGLPERAVLDMLDVWRTHVPRLSLPASSRAALAALRHRWRLGVLTNGFPSIQARKIDALGLGSLVDHVVFATEFASEGKPAPRPFREIARQLGVTTARCVCVGDDLVRDVGGAAAVGMRTVLVAPRHVRHPVEAPCAPDAVVASLRDVPAVAERLMEDTARGY